jgi:hypothetical protein
MTINRLRKRLKAAADLLVQVVPLVLAIADALSGRSSRRKPPP